MVGLALGRQEPQQVGVVVAHGHMQPGTAQLHPQLQRGTGAGHGQGDQLVGQQGRRVGQPLQPPAATHLADELPASSGRGGHWLQRQVLSQPGQPAADLGQRLVQAGVHRHPRRHPQLAQDLGYRWPGAAQHQGRARPVKGGVPDGGEHRGAQGVDPLHLAKITDDGRWLLGQVLEDGPLELGRGRQVEPAGEGQHDTALAAGPLDPHRSLPPPPSSKTTILTSSQTDEVKGLSRWNGGPDTAGM